MGRGTPTEPEGGRTDEAKGGRAIPLHKKVQVSLAEDQYLRLKRLPQKRDISVSHLVRQAIQQVYMDDMQRDLGAGGVQRLGERQLLISEKQEDIGITGPQVLAEVEPGVDI